MQTSSPISTISYNSEVFLKSKLQEIVESGNVEYWMYIKHKAEDDDLKDHIHLYIKPNKRLDTGELKEMLKEVDLQNPDHPLGVTVFCNSKVDDWILYNMHYKPYLDAKLLDRKYHYKMEDFVVSDDASFHEFFYHAMNESEFMKERKLWKLVTNGNLKASNAVIQGSVPISHATGFFYVGKLKRNGD